MESYDVIIVGGGIAGTGLAYNLSKVCPEKKVLLLEKNGLKKDRAYTHRSVFSETIEEYNLPYSKKFNGMIMCHNNEPFTTIEVPMYHLDYDKTRQRLFKLSNVELKVEQATGIDSNKNIIKTKKGNYRYNYLVDCSGINYFLRKIFNKPLPFRYWTAITTLFENTTNLNQDYCYYSWNKGANYEEFYLDGKLGIHGYWLYNNKIDFSAIKPHSKYSFNTVLKNCKIIKTQYNAYPVSPVRPLTFKNFAFVGDSFGDAPPGCCFGVPAALNNSKLLAKAIKNDDLKIYRNEWEKKNLKRYIRLLAVKFDVYNNPPLLEKIKNYPDMLNIVSKFKNMPEYWVNYLKDKESKPPKEITDLFPKRRIFFFLCHLLYLKMKYFYMRFS